MDPFIRTKYFHMSFSTDVKATSFSLLEVHEELVDIFQEGQGLDSNRLFN